MTKRKDHNNLADVLKGIGKVYETRIESSSRKYVLVDIGIAAKVLGLPLEEKYDGMKAIVPVRNFPPGVNYEVNGSELTGYVQLKSGIAVERDAAEAAGLKHQQYQPRKRMILNLGSTEQ